MKKFIRGLFIFITFIILLFIPVLLFILLSNHDISDYFNNVLNIENGDLITFIADYLSLGVALLLGVIVFFQSQKINKLESTQYNTYIGVTNTDYSSVIGDTLTTVCEQDDFVLAYFFEEDKKIIVSDLFLENSSKNLPISIPLKFITKNNPLIVSIQPTKVNLIIKNNGKKIEGKCVKIKKAVLYALLSDNSDFVWHFAVVSPNKVFDNVEINIDTIIKDQNNNIQKLKTKICLSRNFESPKFVLTHSETVKKRGMDLV